jgi:UDP-N-acetylglucosamine 4-epimerase
MVTVITLEISLISIIQMNELAMTTENPEALNTVYNTAFGDRTTLNDMVHYLKEYLSEFDPAIADVAVVHGPNRLGDIPHSLASIDKARKLLNYQPEFSFQQGLKAAVAWYWENLKKE